MKQLHFIWAGVACTLPLLIWSLLQLSTTTSNEEASYTLQNCFRMTVIIQATVLTLYIPKIFDRTQTNSNTFALLTLISIPWPLFTLTWLVGATDIISICLSQVGIALFASLLFVITQALGRFASQNRNKNLALSGLQLVGISLVIIFPWNGL